ncbi:MAG: hypothetical protein HY231_06075 [Acidobacteria bacterium]|nr:hypothetical protein [Acidobacteriota bacterium]
MKKHTALTRSFLMLSLAIVFVLPMSFIIAMKAQTDKRLLDRVQVNKLPEKGKRFALVIGVDEYQDQQISALKGAAIHRSPPDSRNLNLGFRLVRTYN